MLSWKATLSEFSCDSFFPAAEPLGSYFEEIQVFQVGMLLLVSLIICSDLFSLPIPASPLQACETEDEVATVSLP